LRTERVQQRAMLALQFPGTITRAEAQVPQAGHLVEIL
jgi:hypothetical protein